MRFSKKIDKLFSSQFVFYKNKWSFLHQHFSTMLFLLLFGFVIGSMFASVVNTIPIQKHFILDRFVGISLIFAIESVTFLTYRSKKRRFLIFVISSKKLNSSFWRFANLFKIGLMFGFFVDAFKVGS